MSSTDAHIPTVGPTNVVLHKRPAMLRTFRQETILDYPGKSKLITWCHKNRGPSQAVEKQNYFLFWCEDGAYSAGLEDGSARDQSRWESLEARRDEGIDTHPELPEKNSAI